MMAKPIRALELHYPMIQFLIIGNIFSHGFFLDCKIVLIFAHSRSREPRSNKRSGPRLCETRVLLARETLRLFLVRRTDFEQETDCFAVSLRFFVSRYL